MKDRDREIIEIERDLGREFYERIIKNSTRERSKQMHHNSLKKLELQVEYLYKDLLQFYWLFIF